MSKRRKKQSVRTLISILVLIMIVSFQFLYKRENIEKGERFEVSLSKTVDGDTAWFYIEGQETKVRFLYIDTPESTNQIEPYGIEASQFVAKKLESASKIELELNIDGNQYDKYDRLLAWVFVDGKLLQEEIAKNGFCEKFYDYGYVYTYKNEIIKADQEARKNQQGIYSKKTLL